VVAEFGDRIDLDLNARVRLGARKLEELAPPWLVETVPTYRSLAVYIDPWSASREEAMGVVQKICEGTGSFDAPEPERVDIPVCYGGEYGPDMERVCSHAGLTPEQVVLLHSAPEYHVYMIGFSPGFPYLGGMDPRLETPRLGNPRTAIPAGSVGIAGMQTGVYPSETPGGWNLIGRTPLSLFDPGKCRPFLLGPGMSIRFVPVDRSAFPELSEKPTRA
jgi:KipI family sensor histidine kinase inhibitor